MSDAAEHDPMGLAGTVDPVMQAFVDDGKVPGLAYLIHRHGQRLHAGCFGMRDRETGDPMSLDTVCRIASMTKPVTVAVVLALVDNGLLSLDTPVEQILPGFGAMEVLIDPTQPDGEREPQERPITVRHLMTTTSGLGYGIYPRDPLEAAYRAAGLLDVPLAQLVERLVTLPLAFQPGTHWRYSISFDVLGRLAEVVSGKPFDLLLRERLFRPLGMADTGFLVPPGGVERFAALYSNSEEGHLRLLEAPGKSHYLDPDRPKSGGGGLVSTAQDYVRFLQMVLNGGELDGVRALQPGTVEDMVRNQLAPQLVPIRPAGETREGVGYGLGFAVVVDETPWAGHLGLGTFWWGGAYGTGMWADPRRDLVGVLMTQVPGYFEPFVRLMRVVSDAVPLT